ncbi:MAG TPA: hypothetical protein VEH55_06195 [Gaiellaceae bacterium]|nr:hypothetical protein [Gaiellaceae bacterium]
MSVSGAHLDGQDRTSSSETVAGFLAAFSIFASLIALAWHPLRLLGPAILLAMISAGMGGRHRRLAFAAVLVSAACFVLGMTIAVVTQRQLW